MKPKKKQKSKSPQKTNDVLVEPKLELGLYNYNYKKIRNMVIGHTHSSKEMNLRKCINNIYNRRQNKKTD